MNITPYYLQGEVYLFLFAKTQRWKTEYPTSGWQHLVHENYLSLLMNQYYAAEMKKYSYLFIVFVNWRRDGSHNSQGTFNNFIRMAWGRPDDVLLVCCCWHRSTTWPCSWCDDSSLSKYCKCYQANIVNTICIHIPLSDKFVCDVQFFFTHPWRARSLLFILIIQIDTYKILVCKQYFYYLRNLIIAIQNKCWIKHFVGHHNSGSKFAI